MQSDVEIILKFPFVYFQCSKASRKRNRSECNDIDERAKRTRTQNDENRCGAIIKALDKGSIFCVSGPSFDRFSVKINSLLCAC